MRVRDWMSPDPVTTSPGVLVADAGDVMQTYGIRHLPVILNGRVVGMISDRDVRSAFPGATVGRVMSTPAHVIGPDDSLQEAARQILSRWIGSLPVVDNRGKPVGMITTTDCLLASLSVPAT